MGILILRSFGVLRLTSGGRPHNLCEPNTEFIQAQCSLAVPTRPSEQHRIVRRSAILPAPFICPYRFTDGERVFISFISTALMTVAPSGTPLPMIFLKPVQVTVSRFL